MGPSGKPLPALPDASEIPLKLSDYDYALSADRIASHPSEPRPSSKLLKISKNSQKFTDHKFSDVVDFLKAGDVLVLNDTRVIPARLLGKRATGGQLECLLIKQSKDAQVWEALLRPSGRIAMGTVLDFESDGTRIQVQVLDEPRDGSGMRSVRFLESDYLEKLKRIGHVPLPPYIERTDTVVDRERYQTVYAKREGAVAAPTAGLHFDRALLREIEARGVKITYVTLHTGYGTFQPVTVEDIRQHEMFFESYEISTEAAEVIESARSLGGRVVACGTTVVRTLESALNENGKIRSGTGDTNLFIYPSFSFRIVDALITNFHLPKSTLLMLVCAFGGYKKIIEAYRYAVDHGYRFYSYGDAMFIE